jgi:hypothetical protein
MFSFLISPDQSSVWPICQRKATTITIVAYNNIVHIDRSSSITYIPLLEIKKGSEKFELSFSLSLA